MWKYDFIEQKELEIKDLHTFGSGLIVEYRYIDFIREMINETKPLEKYKYFKWVNEKKDLTEEVMWGWIKTEEDAMQRTRDLFDLIESLKGGYKPNHELYYNEVGKPCGGIVTVEIVEENFHILDGHHRVAILHCLGHKKLKCNIYKKCTKKQ